MGRAHWLNVSISSIATAFVVLMSTALLTWFTALGAPARLEWRARIAQARADHYITVTLERGYRGYQPPLLNADQLSRLAKASGVSEVVWATGTISDPLAAPAPFRWASPGYPRYKQMHPLYTNDATEEPSFEPGEVWISRSQAERLFGSAEGAIGKTLLLGGSKRTVTAVYEGAGPILVAAIPEDLKKAQSGRPQGVGEVYVETIESADSALGKLKRWARQSGVLPAGLTLETMSSVLRPDRATLRDPHLSALRWAGIGVLYAMLGIVVFALGIGVSIRLREREKQRALRHVWGAAPTRIVFEEAALQTAQTTAFVFLGAYAGILAALPHGGALDIFGIRVLLVELLVLVIAGLLPIALSAWQRNIYVVLLRSGVGLRARSIAWLAKLAVLVSAATLMFSLSIARRTISDLSSEIRALGAGIYMLYPDQESGRGKPMSLLGVDDLAWLHRRWPEIHAVLLSNFTESALRTPGGAWIPINVRVSLGDYWGVAAQKLVAGNTDGVVVTSDLGKLMGRAVELRLGPAADNLIECKVSGVVEPIRARSVESPRLKTGWVWLAADGKCWPRTLISPVAAVRVPPGTAHPQAMSDLVAEGLSKRHPGRMPLRAKPVIANARGKADRLRKLLRQIAVQQAGLVVLSLLGVVLVSVLLARAWVLVYALHQALGAPRLRLLTQGMVKGLDLVFVPAAIGVLVGAAAYFFWSRTGLQGQMPALDSCIVPALTISVGALALGLLAGGLAARAALRAPPARLLMLEDT
ncbi:ABC transporter permease [Oceanithermus sp.]